MFKVTNYQIIENKLIATMEVHLKTFNQVRKKIKLDLRSLEKGKLKVPYVVGIENSNEQFEHQVIKAPKEIIDRFKKEEFEEKSKPQ